MTSVPVPSGRPDQGEKFDEGELGALLDAIVPADEYPSATDAGGVGFLSRVLAEEKPEWRPRIAGVLELVSAACPSGRAFAGLDDAERLAVLDSLTDEPEYAWFAALVQSGYYADPANGGNRGAASWKMLGWSASPAGGWPEVTVPGQDRRAVIRRDQLADRYDAIVIGSGAGGGVAACALTESGRTVLLVERGDFPDTTFLATDHLRNARTDVGFDHRTLPSSPDNPRTLFVGGESLTLAASDPRWGSNAYTLGGGTRIYGAQAWRFMPEDFRMASSYGVPDGSALADWPISYDDLEPYYTRAEYEVGVSGSTEGDSSGVRRSKPYPMRAMPNTTPGLLLAAGAQKLGYGIAPVPLAINSHPYLGRPACARCSQCVGFACPVEAKNGSQNTVLRRASATGRLSLLTGTRAERIVTDGRGRVTGVLVVGDVGGSVWRSVVGADEVIVSAGATETARVLLHSTSDREPDGLGNNHDQVGRHLQGHLYAGALGIFDEPVNDYVGPGPTVSTNDFRHHNPGIVGGGMLANEFVPTPVSCYGYLRGAGLVGLHGASVKDQMRHLVPRMQRIAGPIQEMTSAEARVRLDPHVRDRFGIPVVQLSGGLHEEDHRASAYLSARAAEWLTASGARQVTSGGRRSDRQGPSSGQHQAGTARMGTEPTRSVTDPDGRVWGHDNLRVVDGSLNVTNGGVNPVLTIFANAFRVMDRMLA
ncbi:MAG: GMC family oxidoreductase [Propionibacteriaceae bacterium]